MSTHPTPLPAAHGERDPDIKSRLRSLAAGIFKADVITEDPFPEFPGNTDIVDQNSIVAKTDKESKGEAKKGAMLLAAATAGALAIALAVSESVNKNPSDTTNPFRPVVPNVPALVQPGDRESTSGPLKATRENTKDIGRIISTGLALAERGSHDNTQVDQSTDAGKGSVAEIHAFSVDSIPGGADNSGEVILTGDVPTGEKLGERKDVDTVSVATGADNRFFAARQADGTWAVNDRSLAAPAAQAVQKLQ